MAVVVVQIAAIRIGDLELHPCQWLIRLLVQLSDHDGSLLFIEETQGLCVPDLDLNGFGRGVENEPLQCPDLLGNNGNARLQALNHNAAIFIGHKLAVRVAYHLAIGFRNQESHPLQRSGGASDVLLNNEAGLRIVFKDQIISVTGTAANTGAAVVPASCSGTTNAQRIAAILNDDGLGGGVEDITAGDFAFRHNHRAAGNEPGHGHSAVLASGIAAQHIAVSVLHGEFCIGDRFSGHRIHFLQCQTAQRLIEKHEGLCVFRINGDSLGLGALIDDIARSCLYLLYDDGAGHAGDANFPFIVRGIEAVAAGQALVVRQQLTIGIDDLELCASQGQFCHAVIFFHNQTALGGVGHDDGLCVTIGANHDICAGIVNDIACRGLDFRQYQRTGGEIGYPDLTIGICCEDPI